MSNKPAPKYQKCLDNEWTHWPLTPQNRYEWSFKSMCHEYSSNRQWKLNYYTEVSYFREIINIYCLREPTYIWIWCGNKKINAWMLKRSLHENACRQSRSVEENNVNDLDPQQWRWKRWCTDYREQNTKKCHTLCYGEPVIIHHCTPLLCSNPCSRHPYLCSSTYILKTTSFKHTGQGRINEFHLKFPH